MSRYFVTGTDTGVGKTVLSLILMKHLYKKGLNPFYIKPFQTGCSHCKDTDSDAWFVYKNIDELKGKDPGESMLYCYNNPLAPYFAARDEDRVEEISYDKIKEFIEEKEKSSLSIVLEGAGGLFVPVNSKDMIIDYIEKLDIKVLIAARAGLGTINHTLLSIEALKNRGIDIAGSVLIKSGNDSVSDKALNENIEAIENFSNTKVLGLIDYIDDFSQIDNDNYKIFDSILFRNG